MTKNNNVSAFGKMSFYAPTYNPDDMLGRRSYQSEAIERKKFWTELIDGLVKWLPLVFMITIALAFVDSATVGAIVTGVLIVSYVALILVGRKLKKSLAEEIKEYNLNRAA